MRNSAQPEASAIDATLMASQMMDYVKAAGIVSPKVEGRIVPNQ